ncbi:hypothetical protein D9M70_616620 [compost metagenome]
MADDQAQEVRRFLQCVGAMRDNDTGHRRVLAQGVHAHGQRAPYVVRHVLAADVGDLLGADVGNAGQLRHGGQQVAD